MSAPIVHELKAHAPFTMFGAATGALLMAVLVAAKVRPTAVEPFFEGMHGAHVLVSAAATAAMYRRYRSGILACAAIGYVGAVGLGTLSDIVFPYLGGRLVGAKMHFHLAFIARWWLINPLALVGVVAGARWPATKIPHAGHVLLSTWASLFYLTAHGQADWLPLLPLVLVVLFVAVWVPCCVSDIVFPLLFVGKGSHEQDGQDH